MRFKTGKEDWVLDLSSYQLLLAWTEVKEKPGIFHREKNKNIPLGNRNLCSKTCHMFPFNLSRGGCWRVQKEEGISLCSWQDTVPVRTERKLWLLVVSIGGMQLWRKKLDSWAPAALERQSSEDSPGAVQGLRKMLMCPIAHIFQLWVKLFKIWGLNNLSMIYLPQGNYTSVKRP